MKLQSIAWRYICLGLSIFISLFLLFWVFTELSALGGFEAGLGINSFFVIDYVSFSFTLLSLILWFSIVWCGLLPINCSFTVLYLFLSISSSIICYFSNNYIFFWVSYELSILFLLLLLIVNSPYSERFIASWYLLGYVIFTSLPMFLCIFYLGLARGSFSFSSGLIFNLSGAVILCLVLLSFLFITKIPLFPFHVWLPIVHAEAPSSVSVFLSGYIMKLGVLGLYRFSSCVLSDILFNNFYVFILLSFSLVTFICACCELDGKRWLAFLSLSHISVISLFICVGDYGSYYLPIYFCLGHGFSAGGTFILLWMFYDLLGSRNWSILKSGFCSPSVSTVIVVLFLFTTASVPPTITFFSEVLIIDKSLSVNFLFSLLMSFYLFVSGLVPLFLFAFLLGGGILVSIRNSSLIRYYLSLVFIIVWAFGIFLFF